MEERLWPKTASPNLVKFNAETKCKKKTETEMLARVKRLRFTKFY
jgi:hypothetical protein